MHIISPKLSPNSVGKGRSLQAPATESSLPAVSLDPVDSFVPSSPSEIACQHPTAPEYRTEFAAGYGPWAVVTGASRGIGAEYADVLAEKGLNIVAVARGKEKLDELAQNLTQRHGVKVKVVAADLGTDEGVERIKQESGDLEVGLLVNNAGIWQMGQFLDNNIERDMQSVKINAEAPMKLTHHFTQGMKERGRGGVINVGSGAALHGVPGQAAYSATKGFLLNFTESLRHELKEDGVDILITNPGPVEGDASSVYDQSKVPLPMVSPRKVAMDSIEKLGKKTSTIPGWLNRQAMAVALRVMPRDFLASVAGYILEHASSSEQKVETPEKASQPEPRGHSFQEKYGPWAVVTGASQGLGAEYAEQLARKGINVVAVARSEDKLAVLRERLSEQYGVEVKSIIADLTTDEGRGRVADGTRDLDVGLLVNNAGMWQMGEFLEGDIEKDTRSLALNGATPLALSHEFGQRMARRGGGGIINVGSGAALHGVPGQATYSATKGFLRNLSESLHQEFKKHQVDVLVTNPGPIKGEASSIYDQSKVPLQQLEAKQVVLESFDKLGKGSGTIPGFLNKTAMAVATTLLSRDHLSAISGYVLKRASGKSDEGKAPREQGILRTAALKARGVLTAVGSAAVAGAGAAWGAAVGAVTNVVEATKLGRSFMGDMSVRAQEITENPRKVEAHLEALGMSDRYETPVNKNSLKLEGKLSIKASMAEFFELWESWIDEGFGSINDRQYADVVLKYKDWAKEIPMLAHIPMTSVDTFTADIKNGEMTSMTETTVTKMAGLIPTSKVDWIYRREETPQVSNSFEKAVDNFDGDVQAVENFYNRLFDPKRVNPDSKAEVVFEVREVDQLPDLPKSDQEYEHKVGLPLPFVAKRPATTLR